MSSLLLETNLVELAEKSWTLCDNLLPESLFEALFNESLRREQAQLFKSSTIGKGAGQKLALDIRSDQISWIDFSTNSKPAWQENLQAYLEQIKNDLNRNLFTGIDNWECHFAKYPAGTRYQTHIDQPKAQTRLDGERVISFVFYLNREWQQDFGGELSIEMPGLANVRVSPHWNRLILFRSDTVPHSVLESKFLRRSLTGWFRKTTVS